MALAPPSSSGANPWGDGKPVGQTRGASSRMGGMAEAASIAEGLGFALPPAHATQNSNLELINEINRVHRAVCDLAVEVEGREDNERTGHVTSEIVLKEKAEQLARVTKLLRGVAQHKERVIAKLQQPLSTDAVPIESKHQGDFAELLRLATDGIPALASGASDCRWVGSFGDPPTVWEDMMHPMPSAVATCIQHWEGLVSVRNAMAALHIDAGQHAHQTLRGTGASSGAAGAMGVVGHPEVRLAGLAEEPRSPEMPPQEFTPAPAPT